MKHNEYDRIAVEMLQQIKELQHGAIQQKAHNSPGLLLLYFVDHTLRFEGVNAF